MKSLVRIVFLCVTSAGLLLSGCSGLNSKSAIKDAVDAHLKQQPGLALGNMTTEVKDVQFSGDTAVAQVEFQSKEAPDLKVEVRYTLRREGNHWEVQSSTPMGGQGGNPHGGAGMPAGAMPPGHPQTVPANPQGQAAPQSSH